MGETKPENIMFTVTKKAREKLKTLLQEEKADANTGVRVLADLSKPFSLDLVFDQCKDNDHIIKTSDGTPILFFASKLMSVLDGMVVDYQESGEEQGFTISTLASTNGTHRINIRK